MYRRYTHSPHPYKSVKGWACLLVAVLSGPDISRKSVMNVGGMNKCYPKIGEALIKDLVEMS